MNGNEIFELFKDLGGEYFLMGTTFLGEPERTEAREAYLNERNEGRRVEATGTEDNTLITVTLPNPLTTDGLLKTIKEYKECAKVNEARKVARLLFEKLR